MLSFSVGHVWISLHHAAVFALFDQVPAMFVVGKPGTWKTWLLNRALAVLGTNATDVCVPFDLSEATVVQRFRTTGTPLVIHDCDDPKLVAKIVESSHQNGQFCTVREPTGVRPSSSGAFTMNPDNAKRMQKTGQEKGKSK